MSGPSTNRADVSTAPFPGLEPQAQQFLQGLFANPAQTAQGLNPPSLFQQQTENAFLQALQGSQGVPGQGVIDAATPIFQENLQRGADVLRQTGPRFASNTERLVQEQGRGSISDFNLFQQQILQTSSENAQNRQLQALLGAGQFSQGQSAQQLQLLLPLLQSGLQAGGAFSPPVIEQNQGFLGGTLLPILGTAGGIATTALGGRGG